MLRNRLYYGIKPFVPWSARMAARRWFARHRREHLQAAWPILPGSEKMLASWPGWPEDKKFAFVLTHDVEGQDGLDKCRQLMELEAGLGFRSCFNFIPEGEYRVSAEFRRQLLQAGFEVGIHDLHHDGTLFQSRSNFFLQAERINHYLESWNAVGFRAGFMRHNLHWQHALRVQYDCSTFDTDPFEPQPDGVGTIFPFWVPNPSLDLDLDPQSVNSQRGYVELPYTLPQDSTLFLLFREQSPEIWLRKLDWVAQHGGMALVNVHPDYVRFPGERAQGRTFPSDHYVQLLQHVRKRYEGQYWQPLPRAVAAHVQSLKTVVNRRLPKRVCIVSHSLYESDARVSRYGRVLVGQGDEVDVISLRADSGQPAELIQDGAKVYGIQTRSRKERSKLSYLLPLLRFLAVAGWKLARLHSRRPYDLIHVHNIPDFLVFAALWPKLRGARVILDIHDLVPEFFTSKFSAAKESTLVRLLKFMERKSAALADHIILANHLWLDKYSSRSAPSAKCSVLINYVDQGIFCPRLRTRRNDGKMIILFPGGLQWHQGLDIAIRAFDKLKDRLPQAEFHIYGEGSAKLELQELTHSLGLDERIRFFGILSINEIAKIMADADLGVVPKRADSFGNEAYSTKIMEFMAVGVPVVISSTKIDRHYFNDSVVRFFESGNPAAMADAIVEMLTNPELRARLVAQGLEFAAANTWESRQGDYLQLVDSLCAGVKGPAPSGSLPLALPVPEPATTDH